MSIELHINIETVTYLWVNHNAGYPVQIDYASIATQCLVVRSVRSTDSSVFHYSEVPTVVVTGSPVFRKKAGYHLALKIRHPSEAIVFRRREPTITGYK